MVNDIIRVNKSIIVVKKLFPKIPFLSAKLLKICALNRPLIAFAGVNDINTRVNQFIEPVEVIRHHVSAYAFGSHKNVKASFGHPMNCQQTGRVQQRRDLQEGVCTSRKTMAVRNHGTVYQFRFE